MTKSYSKELKAIAEEYARASIPPHTDGPLDSRAELFALRSKILYQLAKIVAEAEFAGSAWPLTYDKLCVSIVEKIDAGYEQ